ASTAFGQVIWSDEFDTGTSPDSAVWSYDLGKGGWGNKELQEYTSASQNVRLEDGNLLITVKNDANGFTSARIRTEDKLTYKYGRIEARIKMPDLADGLWPAFWTLGNNFSEVGWPYCGELDIVEMGSGTAIAQNVVNRRVGSAAHWDNQGLRASYTRSLDAASSLTDGFHIFKMDWTPTRITTYIDDQQIWTFYIKLDTCPDCSEFHRPHFVILNIAVGGTYTGLLSDGEITAPTPAEMLVDYVRISDNGFTVLGGSAAPEPAGIGPAYSGSWYNPDQSGHGFSMEFGTSDDGSPLAVVYWYTFDNAGNPIFLLGNGVPDGNTLDIQFESPYGMNYGEFDPASVERPNGGMAHFEFSDKANATFSYTPSEFSTTTWGHSTVIESLPLIKLFEVPVSGSSSNENRR
ncbi:MAG: glycoside hydrolase family 16 protein, partial [Lysobacterales bacterium]